MRPRSRLASIEAPSAVVNKAAVAKKGKRSRPATTTFTTPDDDEQEDFSDLVPTPRR